MVKIKILKTLDISETVENSNLSLGIRIQILLEKSDTDPLETNANLQISVADP
jgi:hypothetical protein